MNSPVEQFTIKVLYELNIIGIDISFTNASSSVRVAPDEIKLVDQNLIVICYPL